MQPAAFLFNLRSCHFDWRVFNNKYPDDKTKSSTPSFFFSFCDAFHRVLMKNSIQYCERIVFDNTKKCSFGRLFNKDFHVDFLLKSASIRFGFSFVSLQTVRCQSIYLSQMH